MNDDRVTVSRYVWVATAAAFLLIFGSIWFVSSLGSNAPGNAADRPGIPADVGRGGETTVYGEHVAAPPPLSVATVSPSSQTAVTLLPPPRPKAAPCPKAKRVEKKVTPRDMFPVGNIALDMPRVRHPFRQVAELFPSFSYEGGVWAATGRYVRDSEADLTPTGFSLATGQALYALANSAAPDVVLFVQSRTDPAKFAVYRRI